MIYASEATDKQLGKTSFSLIRSLNLQYNRTSGLKFNKIKTRSQKAGENRNNSYNLATPCTITGAIPTGTNGNERQDNRVVCPNECRARGLLRKFGVYECWTMFIILLTRYVDLTRDLSYRIEYFEYGT